MLVDTPWLIWNRPYSWRWCWCSLCAWFPAFNGCQYRCGWETPTKTNRYGIDFNCLSCCSCLYFFFSPTHRLAFSWFWSFCGVWSFLVSNPPCLARFILKCTFRFPAVLKAWIWLCDSRWPVFFNRANERHEPPVFQDLHSRRDIGSVTRCKPHYASG